MNRPKFYTSAMAIVGIAIFNSGALNAQTTIQDVGSAHFTAGAASQTSIALDNNGTPYVAFADGTNSNKLSVMKYNGSTWVLVGSAGISPGAASKTCIAIDNSGTPFVLYADHNNYDMPVMVKYTGSTWTQLGSGAITPNKGDDPSIAIDNTGTPYVAFTDWNATYPLAGSVMKYNGSAWVFVGTEGFTGQQANDMHIKFDHNDNLFALFSDGSLSMKATVMKFDGSSWSAVGSKGFSASVIYEPSITMDASGNVYAVYSDWSLAPKQKATVMKYGGSSWSVVGSIGVSTGTVFNPTIGVDKSGGIYIAYNDVDLSTKSVLMKYSGSGWAEVGATGGFSPGGSDFTQMVLDGHGNPYIVYSDTTASGGGKATVERYEVNTAVQNVEQNNEQLVVYPNPAQNSFILKAKSAGNFSIVNMLGQIVKQGKLDNSNNYSATITGLAKGIYLITTKDRQYSQKLIIE